jgi:hypothetical protein
MVSREPSPSASGVSLAVRADEDTRAVVAIYVAAKALLDAAEKLDRIPCGLRHEVDSLLDQQAYPGDFAHVAKALEALADDWQVEIDREQG